MRSRDHESSGTAVGAAPPRTPTSTPSTDGRPPASADLPAPPAAPAAAQGVGERLAPFVAWLAAREIEETVRREHRAAVEGFLRWAETDDGDPVSRRRRYEQHLHRSDPTGLAPTRLGLDCYTEYQHVVARTLPSDHH